VTKDADVETVTVGIDLLEGREIEEIRVQLSLELTGFPFIGSDINH
jgi:hypothetical protein